MRRVLQRRPSVLLRLIEHDDGMSKWVLTVIAKEQRYLDKDGLEASEVSLQLRAACEAALVRAKPKAKARPRKKAARTRPRP